MGGIQLHQVRGAHGIARRAEGQEGNPRSLAGGRHDLDHTAIVRPRDTTAHHDVEPFGPGPERLKPIRVVVIAGDRHHGRDRAKLEQRSIDERFRIRRRRGRFVEISRHQYQFRMFTPCDVRDLRQHRGLFIEAGLPSDRLAHVPVRRMQNPHDRGLALGTASLMTCS